MLRIVSHLEHLLRIHDCVVVPQFGGFVLQAVPASYVMGEHLFRPMHKEVVFNANLKHNDGLLANQYMDSYGVSYPRAYRMVEEDVEEIKSLLFKELKVSLGNVGMLRRGTEGQVVFQSGDVELFSVNSYGLSPFQVETWEDLQGGKTPRIAGEKRQIFYIPVNRNILRGIASTAAAIALFLMISTPVKEINPSSYTASFVPAEMVRTANKTEATPAATTATAKPTTTTRKNTTTMPTPSATATRKAETAERLPVYYVVIGSVKTKKQADEIITKVGRAGIKSVNKVVVADKIRVYADKFTDKDKAEVYLAKIRKNSNYQDAWIYTRNK
ncbi:MAG: SPOR domain-containing protein [Tannerellaceae bacterium]|jgi:hypothetical protein|nr:SPOR domain-containing protein [Tannerellaceae bacterium]